MTPYIITVRELGTDEEFQVTHAGETRREASVEARYMLHDMGIDVELVRIEVDKFAIKMAEMLVEEWILTAKIGFHRAKQRDR